MADHTSDPAPSAAGDTLPYRQIHLDFHTSPHIPDVAADFDADRFAGTLADAGVDSVTCFARCHHGMIYYPTKKHPHLIHPNLKVPDLLNQQIEACHKRGIRVPIYTTVEWDKWWSDNHPECLVVDKEGKHYFHDPLHPGFYFNLDVGHPTYRQFLFDHIDDLFDCVPAVDGVFLDITPPRVNYQPRALADMVERGLDPENDADVEKHSELVSREWKQAMFEHIKAHDKDCGVFFNQGHVGPDIRATLDYNTHLELESLPSGWGYTHFPTSQCFARTLGVPTLSMTGKFHTAWGDTGSYKNPAALEFECMRSVAMGAGVSVGDQLHPRGELDRLTYQNIGEPYNKIKALEPWAKDAKAFADVAVMTPEAFGAEGSDQVAQFATQPDAGVGAVLMLTELREQFDFVDPQSDLSKYKVLILPDVIPANDAVVKQVDKFLAGGGKLLTTGHSGRRPDGSGAGFLPVDLKGPAEFSPDYLRAGELSDGPGGFIDDSPHVMYERAEHVEPRAGASVIATVERPYFNRTWQHFSSHRHTPYSGEDAGYPAAVADENRVHLAHPVFTQYRKNAPRWCKRVLGNALARLRPVAPVVVDGPATLTATLLEKDGNQTLHLLHYIPQRIGDDFDTLEDIIPLHDVVARVRTAATTATVQPEGTKLDATNDYGTLTLTLPKLEGYALIELT